MKWNEYNKKVITLILCHNFTCFCLDNKPQTLLFSATVPPWVRNTSKKYMSKNMKVIDLVGTDINRGSTTVEV